MQDSVIDFWLAWPIGSMLDSTQTFAEPVPLVQVHASPTASSEVFAQHAKGEMVDLIDRETVLQLNIGHEAVSAVEQASFARACSYEHSTWMVNQSVRSIS